MKNCLLGIFTLILSNVSICFGQTNFENGYYITYNGDSVNGLIEYKPDDSNARYCTFKESSKDEVKNLSSLAVHSYVINNSIRFQAFNFDIGAYQVRRFLQYLVEGELSLLMYSNGKTPYYFSYDKRTNELVNLENNSHVVRSIDTKYKKSDQYSKEVLPQVMSDHWDDLRPTVDMKRDFYDDKVLTDIFLSYNQLIGSPATSSDRLKSRVHVGFDLLGKAGVRKANYSLDPVLSFQSGRFEIYGGGGALIFSLPRKYEHVKLQLSAVYLQSSLDAFIQDATSNNEITIENDIIEVGLGPIIHNVSGARLTFGVNYVFSYILQETYTWRQEQLISDQIYTNDITDYGPLTEEFFQGVSVWIGKDWGISKTRSINTGVEYSYLKELGGQTDFQTLSFILRIGILP